jgi:protein O-GlcNAc transferase
MINRLSSLPIEHLHHSTCPACGFHWALDFYRGGKQPLATLGWPSSFEDAQAMERLPLDFVRCLNCGHIFNRHFDYTRVPYVNNPNRMYNRSALWQAHLGAVCQRILPHLPENPVVVEIGCGEGHLLSLLAQSLEKGSFIGFDPHADLSSPRAGVELRAELFEPHRHLLELKPDILISRHVLEHLMNPLAFIQETAFFCNWTHIFPLLFVEVPCIDNALKTGRFEDFYYEHNSHFSRESFFHFLNHVNQDPYFIETGYGDEVIFGLTSFQKNVQLVNHAQDSMAFLIKWEQIFSSVTKHLDFFLKEGKQFAIWGGTGKGAAFLNSFEMDSVRFPLVIDSDAGKVGTFVPGTGQEIKSKEYLKAHPVALILIATQWRARDIVQEILANQIPFQQILIEYQGNLVDYFESEHPYR